MRYPIDIWRQFTSLSWHGFLDGSYRDIHPVKHGLSGTVSLMPSAMTQKDLSMQYRRLGHSGLQVSELSLGSWVTYHNQVDASAAREMMAAAFDAGVNFFDNAEAYAQGHSEIVMGEAIKALKWPRLNYIVSTKFFWGLPADGPSVNRKDTLNRKYLSQAIDGSLKRMGLDFIDLVYCHRPDPNTPIEETVWAMNDMIRSGKALYWGTSEWSAQDIRSAWDIAVVQHSFCNFPNQ